MANAVANVVAGRPKTSGGIYSAAIGTALPTDAVVALNASFKSFGYVSDDGVTENTERESNTIKAWGGDTVKVVQSSYEVTYEFTLIETLNEDVAKGVYGDGNVTVTAATAGHGKQLAIQLKSEPLPHKEYTIEVQDGDAVVRIVIPDGQITAVGEITYSDESVIGYPVTVTAFPDSSGVNAYKYTDDGVLAP